MNKFKEYLVETKLSRVITHFKNKGIPVAIATAFRGEYTYKDNLKRNKKLASDIKSNGYGYVYVDGHWIEKGDNNDGKEDSILIIGNENDNGKLLGLVKKWVKQYNQDAIVFKPEGTEKVELVFQSGSPQVLGKLNIKEIEKIKADLASRKDVDGAGFTKLKNNGERTFVFESERDEPNWIGKQIIK